MSETTKTRYQNVRYRGKVLYFRIKTAEGKWRDMRFGKDATPKEAEEARAKRQRTEDKIREGTLDPLQQELERNAARPVEELVTAYIDNLKAKGVTKSHHKNTKAFINEGLKVCGVTRILEFTPTRVNQWLSSLDKLSARSKNVRRRSVLAFCRWAYSFGLIPRNPLPSGELIHRFNEDADRRRVSRAMTTEEADKLFSALLDPETMLGDYFENHPKLLERAKERSAYYLLAANTGLRWREIARLRWGDIHLDRGLVVVPASMTKNSRQADLPLVREVVDVLSGIRPAFPSDTDKVFSGEPTLKTWKRDLQRAGLIGKEDKGYRDGLEHQIDRKCLRMSFCTWLKNAGVDLRDAQRLMRHSDPKLTSNIYTDLRVSDLRKAVEKIKRVAPKSAKASA